ncbi:MAG: methionine--tRNA ligase [Candidatus Moranbacteria bacterium]|nr:methionine--tRNA ligase [Candidatus Moranbacteria bacterium]
MKKIINFKQFNKLDIRIGTVIEFEEIKNSDKLLRLVFDVGKKKIQIITGMKKFYKKEDFLNKQFPVLLNLEPRKIMGLESQGMLLAADQEGEPVLLCPVKKVRKGSVVH